MKRFISVALLLLLNHALLSAHDSAHSRAARLGNGMNLTFLDNYWKGTKEKRFADFLNEADLAKREKMMADIAGEGFKTVRIPVCFSAWASLNKPFRWETNAGLLATDKMVQWALGNRLNVIIDMHHPELDGSVKDSADIERVAWIWEQVALRYKQTDPEKVFFELWNEPHDIEAGKWRKSAERLIKTVRYIAPKHTLIVGFHDWNGRQALVDSKPFSDGNIIYTFHYYDPFLFTHQSASWSAEGLADIKEIPFPFDPSVPMATPESAKGKWSGNLFASYEKDSNSQKMFADLKAAKDWSTENKVPIYVGEFGSFGKSASAESRCRHWRVLYSAFRELEIPNAVWEWDGGFNLFEVGTNRIAACVKEFIEPGETAGWTLTWSDEFDGNEGSGVNGLKWKHELGGAGWGNKEFQYYTDDFKNAHLDGNGFLAINAIEENPAPDSDCWYGKCKFSSARLITKGLFTQKYGRFEARIKIPAGQGIWPAFWLLGDDIDSVGWPKSGEIDVMENIGREPTTVHGTVHGPGYSGGDGIGGEFQLPDKTRFADDFHVYSIEWEPEEIRWYVDGKQYYSVSPRDLPNDSKWVFDHPHFMLLNLAVGGNWPGSPDETTVFPQTMKIDYVRVYEKSKD